MNVGFDLDGVLYPWHDSIYSHFVQFKKYNDSYTEFWTNYWKIPEVQEQIVYMTTVPIFCEDREPVVGALEVLNKIADTGHTIFYITNRPDEVIFATEHYIDRHKFPFKENLHIGVEKATYARSVNLNLFIDDREKNIKEMMPVCTSILMAQPWNKPYQEEYPTIHNIREILNFIKE